MQTNWHRDTFSDFKLVGEVFSLIVTRQINSLPSLKHDVYGYYDISSAGLTSHLQNMSRDLQSNETRSCMGNNEELF